MYRHILISTDGSELSRRAVQHGLELAKAVGAKVTALTVEGVFRHQEDVAGADEDAYDPVRSNAALSPLANAIASPYAQKCMKTSCGSLSSR